MKKSIAKKWVKALRSGEYLQGSRRLLTIADNDDECFCCLGVLCNLATEEGYGEWSGYLFKDEEKGLDSRLLPTGVVKWAGMKTSTGTFGVNSLISLNDSGLSFNELAEIIETNYEDL